MNEKGADGVVDGAAPDGDFHIYSRKEISIITIRPLNIYTSNTELTTQVLLIQDGFKKSEVQFEKLLKAKLAVVTLVLVHR
jgi:hypothetical protein